MRLLFLHFLDPPLCCHATHAVKHPTKRSSRTFWTATFLSSSRTPSQTGCGSLVGISLPAPFSRVQYPVVVSSSATQVIFELRDRSNDVYSAATFSAFGGAGVAVGENRVSSTFPIVFPVLYNLATVMWCVNGCVIVSQLQQRTFRTNTCLPTLNRTLRITPCLPCRTSLHTFPCAPSQRSLAKRVFGGV